MSYVHRPYALEFVRPTTRQAVASRYPRAFSTAEDARWAAFLTLPHTSTLDDRRADGLEASAKVYIVTADGWLRITDIPEEFKDRRLFKIGQEILAGIAGVAVTPGKRVANFSGREFINARVKATGINLIVIESNYVEGLCRSVIPMWPDNVYNVIQNDLSSKPTGKMVYIVSGIERDRNSLSEDLKALRKSANALVSQVAAIIFMHGYMNKLNSRPFIEARDTSFDKVWAKAQLKHGASKESAERALRAYYAVPVQVFRVKENSTTRLIPFNPGLTTMPSEFCDDICFAMGWIKLDIVGCQYAICVSQWKLRGSSALLANGGNLWDTLYTDLKTDASFKPGLKIGTCSSLFGMSVRNIVKNVDIYFATKLLQKALEAANGDRKVALTSLLTRKNKNVAQLLANFLSDDPRSNVDVDIEDDNDDYDDDQYGDDDDDIAEYFEQSEESVDDGKRVVKDLKEYFNDSKAFHAIMKYLSNNMGKRFIKQPLIAELLQERQVQLDKIIREGKGVDCFGTEYSIISPKTGKKNPRRVLALLAHAVETKLIATVFQTAEESNGNITVLCFKYDGVYVRIGRNVAHNLRVIQSNFSEAAKIAVVEKHADGTETQHPVFTKLEVTMPPA